MSELASESRGMAVGADPERSGRASASRLRTSLWERDVLAAVAGGARFAGLFGTAEADGCRVGVLLAGPDDIGALTMVIRPDRAGRLRYPSLSPRIAAATWYERALHDLFGVVPIGHPRLDPLLLVRDGGAPAPTPGHPSRPEAMAAPDLAGTADVAGRGVFSIPFGPVRSGVAESIEFLIETPGEDIPHLNIRPHYKHRGVAKAFEDRDLDDGVLVAERVEGIASVAHGLAYCHAVERVAGVRVPVAARLWRVVLAEIERITNHLDALARSAEAAGLAVASARLSWHKEATMRLTSALTGHRFGRGLVVPGGLSRRPAFGPADAASGLAVVLDRVRRDCAALLTTPSFLDRVRGTGRLDPTVAATHGALGPIGRGSGFDDDDRRVRPYDGYPDLPPPTTRALDPTGDALARLQVRVAEVDAAGALISGASAALVDVGEAPLRRQVDPVTGEGIGWSEGPQGEELYFVELVGGRIRRCFARSASLHNLFLLHRVFHGDVLTDFPFIEASFGLGYAGVAM